MAVKDVNTTGIMPGSVLTPGVQIGSPDRTSDMLQHTMNAKQSDVTDHAISNTLQSIMRDLANKQAPIKDAPVIAEPIRAPEVNPHHRQKQETIVERQSIAELEAAKEAEKSEHNMQSRTLTITQKSEHGRGSTRVELKPDRERKVRNVDGSENTREIMKHRYVEQPSQSSRSSEFSKKMERPRHFTESREDRIAAAEAKFGSYVEAIQNQAQHETE